jgi:excisionase family DNA binding protein
MGVYYDMKRSETTQKKPRRRPRGNVETLQPRDVARITGFGITNTYKMLEEGVIPSIKIGNRRYTPKAALAKWLASCDGKLDSIASP